MKISFSTQVLIQLEGSKKTSLRPALDGFLSTLESREVFLAAAQQSDHLEVAGWKNEVEGCGLP